MSGGLVAGAVPNKLQIYDSKSIDCNIYLLDAFIGFLDGASIFALHEL